MTTYMSDILCVTNRHLCTVDFLERIEQIAACHPAGIILREKDLNESQYEELARNAIEICRKYDCICILHNYVNVARKLNYGYIHLPLQILRGLSSEERMRFIMLGASCHSVEDAAEAEKLGCTYITAGHIFETDCKKGMPGRGLDFLRQVCGYVQIPVYAIGGIHHENIISVRTAGASGACIMSGIMSCDNPGKYLEKFI